MTIPPGRLRPTRPVLLAGVLLALFVALGLVAHHALSGTAVDHIVLDALITDRSPALTAWALTITTVFSPVGTGSLAVLAAVVLWWRLGTARPALLVVATLASAAAASTLTKVVVGARRPPPVVQLIAETDHSFPSGHVTGTVALLGALTVAVGHHAGRTARAVMAAAAALAAVAVGFTRLYLGVHWASDVVGGLLLGAAAVVLAYLAAPRMMEPASATAPSATAAVRLTIGE